MMDCYNCFIKYDCLFNIWNKHAINKDSTTVPVISDPD